MSTLLHVEHVTKTFCGLSANSDITLSVPGGAVVGLIGPNGSGKTTLFNSIVGYHPLDSGRISFDGREISHLRVPQIARLGLLRTFQQTRVYTKMTCMQNMEISTRQTQQHAWRVMFNKIRAEETERAEALLEFVGLYPKRHLQAGDLSFGQQKLLEFAMALMTEPKMLLLDEPTAGINPTLINGLIDRLRRVNATLGVTLLVIEHNMRVIMSVADYVYCLAHGELLAEGTPETIKSDARVIDAYLGAY
jgi:ABC-type branched-subunit amino acid transport system ATPase component